jgi:tetratricopeptide (TPR) repeat protein
LISSLPHRKWKVALLALLAVFLIQASRAQDSIPADRDIESYFNAARAFENENKIDLALESLDKSAVIAEENENEKSLVDCYHKFAELYFLLNKRENTIFYWDRAAVLLSNLEYPHGHAVHKYIEAILLYDSGNNFQALLMLNEAKQLSNDRNLLNNILLLEGNIYLSIEK